MFVFIKLTVLLQYPVTENIQGACLLLSGSPKDAEVASRWRTPVLMYVASLVTNHLNWTDLEVARYGKEVVTFDLCCLFRTGWSVSTWKCPARGVRLNKLTSGRVMTISTALGDVGKTPPWKETPRVWKRDTFKWEAEGRNWGSLPWRTQEMISGVNEAFQECSATSWYGEVNKTYHLKGNLAWKAQQRFTQVLEKTTHTEGDPQRARPWLKCPLWGKWEGFFFNVGKDTSMWEEDDGGF